MPLALAGGAAPSLWLLLVRAGGLLALAGAYRLGARLAGRTAGLVAALALLLLDDFVSLAWRGASEPLLLASILWAIERALAGRWRGAFALGVAAALIRPEVLPFLVLFAAWRWRMGGAGARERMLLLAGLALVPLLWLGLPGFAGDPLAASATATQGHALAHPAWTALRRGLALPVALTWALALAALLLRPRDRVVRALALGALAWLALVVAMTAAGYAGVARYMLPAAALGCVLAGVGAASLIARLPRAGRGAFALVLLLACAALALPRALTLDDQVRAGVDVAHAQSELRAAIDAVGGAAPLRGCALGGWVAVNRSTQTALAWELRLPLDRVARTMSHPGIELRGPHSATLGTPAPIALGGAPQVQERAHAGRWQVLAVRASGGALPRACDAVGGVRSRTQNHVA